MTQSKPRLVLMLLLFFNMVQSERERGPHVQGLSMPSLPQGLCLEYAFLLFLLKCHYQQRLILQFILQEFEILQLNLMVNFKCKVNFLVQHSWDWCYFRTKVENSMPQ